jgi:hypothetical protein
MHQHYQWLTGRFFGMWNKTNQVTLKFLNSLQLGLVVVVGCRLSVISFWWGDHPLATIDRKLDTSDQRVYPEESLEESSEFLSLH